MKLSTVLSIIIVTSLAAPLGAHTGIQSTQPAHEQTLDTPPESLSLTFKAPVKLLKLTVTDAQKNKVKLGFKPMKQSLERIEVPVPSISAGAYAVRWVSMGKDGHKMSGTFTFTITP